MSTKWIALLALIYLLICVPLATRAMPLGPCKETDGEAKSIARQFNAQHDGAFDFQWDCRTGFLKEIRLNSRAKANGPAFEKLPPHAHNALDFLSKALGMHAQSGQCELVQERVFKRPAVAETIERIRQRFPVNPVPQLLDTASPLAAGPGEARRRERRREGERHENY